MRRKWKSSILPADEVDIVEEEKEYAEDNPPIPTANPKP